MDYREVSGPLGNISRLVRDIIEREEKPNVYVCGSERKGNRKYLRVDDETPLTLRGALEILTQQRSSLKNPLPVPVFA